MNLASEKIKDFCRGMDIDTVGITPAVPVRNKDLFLERVADGFPAEMGYLTRNIEVRLDPEKLLPGARSIIVIGQNYYPTDDTISKMQQPYKIAKYAWGIDYHIILRKKLKKLRAYLNQQTDNLTGRICVDTAPFMDIYWAEQAGLGWQGKNSLLISKKHGPRLMIGSLVIDKEIDQYDQPHTNHCGKCTACIEACPTGAIKSPYYVDAARCISYWTIESKAESIPVEIKEKMNNYIFGCDLCSDICPFTRFQKPVIEPHFSRINGISALESGRLSEFSENEFENMFKQSPIYRPGLSGIWRNISSIKSVAE